MTIPDLDSARLILRSWPGGRDALARELDVSYFTVASWDRRNAIPQAWWDMLEMAARKHRVRPPVTYARLRKIAADAAADRRKAVSQTTQDCARRAIPTNA